MKYANPHTDIDFAATIASRKKITHTEIIEMRKLIHASNSDIVKDILSALNNNPLSLTKAQTREALAWLKSKIWRQNGELRQTATAKCFGFRERTIIEKFTHFTLDGFVNEVNEETGKPVTSPIYRVHCDEATFSYTVDYWGRVAILD